MTRDHGDVRAKEIGRIGQAALALACHRPSAQSCAVYASGLHHHDLVPSAAARGAVAALFVNECELDAPGVSIPRAEPHLVVRFGPKARQGIDVHVMGARQRARRKTLHRGQRVVTVRLHLGTHAAVIGASPSELAERVIPLEDLWGSEATRLADRLAQAGDIHEAAVTLEAAIAKRLAASSPPPAHTRLALDAVARLATARVNEVADALGVSERNLRRVFREVVGMSPKEFARLTRFHSALHASRATDHVDWARIAAVSGYYDQAHLIADFREIVGVTPRALLNELRGKAPAEPGRTYTDRRYGNVTRPIGYGSMATSRRSPSASAKLPL